MIATTPQQIEYLRTSGTYLSEILRAVSARATAGTSAKDLDTFAEGEIRARGALPVFLNYRGNAAAYPYPASICISINDEVVHGIPVSEKIIQDGDIVSLDLGLSYNGFITDAAVTLVVGNSTPEQQKLIDATYEALAAGIRAAKVGGHVEDIGAAISEVAQKYGVSVVQDLGGHGTGKALHEAPYIANFGTMGKGEVLKEGMVLALEPIFTLGRGAIKLMPDRWTYTTKDGSLAAHVEHTILIGKNGAEILTL